MTIEAFKIKYFTKKHVIKKKMRRKKKTQPKGMYWVNPFTGKKEPII